MRFWYMFHKFIGGVLIGMIFGGTASVLLMLCAVVCYFAMS